MTVWMCARGRAHCMCSLGLAGVSEGVVCFPSRRIFFFFFMSCWMNTTQQHWVGETRFLLLPAMLPTEPGAAPAPSTAAPASAGILGSQRNEL